MPGGINEADLEQARKIIIEELNFGLDPELIDDLIGATIDSSKLPTITYESEALAELIRRIHTALGARAGTHELLGSRFGRRCV